MGHSMIDSALFRNFFGSERAREIFSDENMLNKWFEYWAALAQAEEEQGIIPEGVADEIRNKGKVQNFDLKQIRLKIEETTHPCIPVLWELEEITKDGLGKWAHWGATLQDLTDTTFSLLLKEGSFYFEEVLIDMIKRCLELAKEYRNTSMPGRTHQMHAVPMTFGEKCAIYADELSRSLTRLRDCRERVFKGQFAGASATLASLTVDGHDGLAVQKRLCELLDISVPSAPWHSARDTMAEYSCILNVMAASCSRICFDLQGMHKQEVAEIEEDFPRGRLGSSTMPQKRNPDNFETVIGLAWIVNAQANVAINCQHVQHERCTACMMADWYYVPEINIVTGSILEMTLNLLRTLHVYPENMRRNLNITRGGLNAEAMMIKLGHKIGRMEAHHVVYEAAMKSYEEKRDLGDVLIEDHRVTSIFSEEEVRSILMPENYVGIAPQVVDQVIASVGKIL